MGGWVGDSQINAPLKAGLLTEFKFYKVMKDGKSFRQQRE